MNFQLPGERTYESMILCDVDRSREPTADVEDAVHHPQVDMRVVSANQKTRRESIPSVARNERSEIVDSALPRGWRATDKLEDQRVRRVIVGTWSGTRSPSSQDVQWPGGPPW